MGQRRGKEVSSSQTTQEPQTTDTIDEESVIVILPIDPTTEIEDNNQVEQNEEQEAEIATPKTGDNSLKYATGMAASLTGMLLFLMKLLPFLKKKTDK